VGKANRGEQTRQRAVLARDFSAGRRRRGQSVSIAVDVGTWGLMRATRFKKRLSRAIVTNLKLPVSCMSILNEG
jgi:hypothetical protein